MQPRRVLLDKSLSERFGEWWHDYWPSVTNALSTIALAGSAILLGWAPRKTTISEMLNTWSGYLFIGAGLGCVISQIYIQERASRITSLKNLIKESGEKFLRLGSRLEEAQGAYRDLFEGQLAILANHLNYGDTERITVYKHEERWFVILGRYSKNPYYQTVGRGFYPDHEGCIGYAWKHGEAFEDAMPDAETNPAEYVNFALERWRIRKTVVRQINMKSRSYAAFEICDSTGNTRIAVIVFESMRQDVLKPDVLRGLLEGPEGKRLSQFLESMRFLEPEPTYAQKEGY